MAKKNQLELFAKGQAAFGGTLFTTRRGRAIPRPLATRESMHLVLRSTKAKGAWSFRHGHNETRIKQILRKFAAKNGVRIYSLANVGNHLHLHIQLRNRHTYRPFIRALTAAIAMAITGASRWKPLKKEPKDRFWDYRPYTRIVRSWRAALNLKDYIKINQLEGVGCKREHARVLLREGVVRLGADSS